MCQRFYIVIAVFLAATVVPVGAGAVDISAEYASEMLGLINEARLDPLGTAQQLGFGIEEIPDVSSDLPPFQPDERLDSAARRHVDDMFANGYYSHTSPNGETWETRIANSNYAAISSGESIGMLKITNFIKPEKALKIIFENMLREQLDPESSIAGTILDDDFSQAGIGIGAGPLELDGEIHNVYIAVCLFGSEVGLAELQLFQLVNQARTRPLDVAESFGYDRNLLIESLPEMSEILTGGLPPLVLNSRLNIAAKRLVDEMETNGYSDYLALEDRPFADRIGEAGYDGEQIGESAGMVYFSSEPTPDKERLGVARIFKKMFAEELKPGNEERNILNPDFREAGVGFLTDVNSVVSGNVFLSVLEFGSGVDTPEPSLSGVTFADADADGLYDPGEGLKSADITIEGESAVHGGLAGRAGGFATQLDPGIYRVAVKIDECEFFETVEIVENSEFLMIPTDSETGGCGLSEPLLPE